MKPKSLFFFVLFFASISNLFAQETFVEGYYINSKNDTIRGLILDYDWEVNPKKVTFKSNSNQQEIFSSTAIKGFGLFKKDEHFVSRDFILSKVIKEVIDGGSPISEKIPVSYFFRVLIQTPVVNLYSVLPDEDDRMRFFIEKDGDLLELENYEYYFQEKNSMYLKKVDNYKKQLLNVFADCNDFVLGEVEYKEGSLKREIIKYCEIKTGKKFISKEVKSTRYLTVFGDVVPDQTPYYLVGIGIRRFSARKFGQNFIDIELRPFGSLNRDGVRGTLELLVGKMVGRGNTKIMYAAGVGLPNVSIVPAFGVNFNNRFSLEARYNTPLFKTDVEKIRYFAIRMRYYLVKLKSR
jgi:hypothetical protein